jgi:uncharacterized protein (DUF1330 family)
MISPYPVVGRDQRGDTMKAPYIVALSVAAGMVLGAGAVQSLRAQTKPPVYQITLQEVSNPDAFQREFTPLARASVRQYGGRPLAGGDLLPIEGTSTKNRVAITQWDSVEQIRKWVSSPEYQKAREIGNKYANFLIIAVEGIPPQ